MTKVKHLLAAFFVLTSFCALRAQYPVHFRTPEGDSSFPKSLGLMREFHSQVEAARYLARLPMLLQAKGYIAASVDSLRIDSARGCATLYLGGQYRWTRLRTGASDRQWLEAARIPVGEKEAAPDFPTVRAWQQKMLDYLEEHGHPFGRVYLDSVDIAGSEVSGLLRVDPGPLYRIDSIRVFGEARVSNEFLQRYLEITDGSPYSRKKLDLVSRRIAETGYLQEERPYEITLLGSGSVLNLYLKPRKTSQANVLVGFLPNSNQLGGAKRFMLTVDANVMLRNALGSGETIGFVWQQLQQRSPRLNLLFEQPYAFHSPFGLNFSFDMYKQDSAFLNLNMNLGTSYRVQQNRTATLFLQRRQTNVTGVNTDLVLQSHRLPREADVSSLNLGAGYIFSNTDYRFNPRKGNEFSVTGSAGTKKIRRNTLILELVDPNDPSFKFESLYDTIQRKAYQFRVVASGAHFLPLGGQSTLKMGVSGGIYQSANYFRNELFQIGGFRLLRGFDEESQFVSRYAIGTLEYRLRVDVNSYFFAFGDGGWGKHLLETHPDHFYLGTGVGLSLETRAGVISMAWAVGKRDDTELNLRQSKFHLGLASYF